jgi:hypothetical protein
MKEQLEKVVSELKLPARESKLRDVKLPNIEPGKDGGRAPAGVRLFVRIPEHERASFRVPIVQAVAMMEEDWSVLSYPKTKKEVQAGAMKLWMAEVFPAGMKEMVGPNIQNDEVTGTLTFQPAGADKAYRYAIVSGEVRLVLAGRTKVTHTGKLDMLLKYSLDADAVVSMQAVYEGNYPETDPKQNRTTWRKFIAAMESLPK